MFFTESRIQFFAPLTGKYREIVAECLRLLYQRLYTDLRDYGHSLHRDQLVDIFKEAIARTPVLDFSSTYDNDQEGRFKNSRELANFVINKLIEHGWIEKQVDEASLQSSFGFTRMGRLFTQPFAEKSNQFRTRNRNTRNTRNSLQAFLENAEIHDLLDAYEYSERIISDFTDVIGDLEERKRQLVKEVESRHLIEQASDAFFDFMETVFKPDLEVRLSVDSVEKYRDQISDILTKIRRKRKYGRGDTELAQKDWRAVMELELRKALPQKVVPGVSLLETILEAIDRRLKNACDIMLPALRRSLNTFTQRADIIIRQLSFINSQQQINHLDFFNTFLDLPDSEQDELLGSMGRDLAEVNLRYLDPAQLVIRQRRSLPSVISRIDELSPPASEALQEIYIQNALDRAFTVQSNELKQYLSEVLNGLDHVKASELPSNTMRDVLHLAHAIEASGQEMQSGKLHFEISQNPDDLLAPPKVTDGEYFKARDQFVIRLIDDAP